jgi:nucleotide-binding universal stress UspA family protein
MNETFDAEPIKKVLIPTDDSRNARVAIARGLYLANLAGAEVTALHVVDLTSFVGLSDGLALPNLRAILVEAGQEAVGYARSEGERKGVRVSTMVVESGAPAHKIVEISHGFDLIVMGSLGRTGMSHLLLGSVAERVVRHAQCPVLVVRTPSGK